MLASEIHVPQDLVTLLELMKRNPDALIYAGGTEILRERATRTVELPPVILCTSSVAELKRMTLTERFIEIGAGVLLSDIEKYSPGSIQPAVVQALGGIANIPVRNLATIGGNLACRHRFMDLWPVLACLDGLVELRNSGGSKWININRLADEDGRPSVPPRRAHRQNPDTARAMGRPPRHQARTMRLPHARDRRFRIDRPYRERHHQRLHLVLAGERCLHRSRELESAIVGRRLPLKPDERHLLADEYRRHFVGKLGSHEPGLCSLPELALSQLAM